MNINRFPGEQQDVFWVVGLGKAERHATTLRPGAVYAGQLIPVLCGGQVKVPQSTPLGRDPGTKDITARCLECEKVVADENHAETTWAF